MSLKIWSFRDNRCEHDRERGIGKVTPLVILLGDSEDQEPWSDDSVSMTPRQARLLAKRLGAAADYAESAANGREFEDIVIS